MPYSRVIGKTTSHLSTKSALMAFMMCVIGACSTRGVSPAIPENVIPQDLLIVDCVLPPQVRQLGTRISYLARRRALRTTGAQCALRGGEYVAYDRADFKSALAVWLPRAEQGDPEAQTYVGEIHEKGLGTPASYKQAALWYQRAAQQDYSRAQINLGYLYESGLGVQRDLPRALNLYRQASGFTSAQLEFVSSIEVAERSAMHQQAQWLKTEVQDLQSQISSARQTLLKQQKRQTRSQQEIKHLRKALSKRQASISAAPGIALSTVQARQRANDINDIENLKRELASREEYLATQDVEIDRLQHKLSAQQARVAPKPVEQIAQTLTNSPSINIIDPPVLLTRGMPVLANTSGPVNLIGKVESAESLFAFRINGLDHPVSGTGMFQFHANPTTPENLELLAVDTQGASTRLSLSIGSSVLQPPIDSNPLPATTGAIKTLSQSLDGVDFGNYHALIIGNDTYSSLSNLRTAGNDAIAVENILREKYGFKTVLLLNANQRTLLSALERMRASLGSNDNLVIYYAGHGEFDSHSGLGYWLPTDATAGDRTHWIANSAITAMIDTMAAKHVLVIADSCYSGTMTRSSVARPLPETSASARLKWLSAVSKSRVRTVLSSGGVRPVLDGTTDSEHSIFAQHFIGTLHTNDEILEAYNLFFHLQARVAKASANLNAQQVPQYAPIKHSGHQAGEFIFVPTAQNTVRAGPSGLGTPID